MLLSILMNLCVIFCSLFLYLLNSLLLHSDMKLISKNSKLFSINFFLITIKKILTIYGLGCFKYPSKTFQLSYFGVLTLTLNVALNIFMSLEILIHFNENGPALDDNAPKIINLILNGTFLMSFVSPTIVIGICFIMRKKMFLLFKKIEEFEQEINNLEIKVNNYKDIAIALIILSLKIVLILFGNMQIKRHDTPILFIFILQFTTLAIYAPLEVYFAIIYFVRGRIHLIVNALKYLNEFLKIL